MAETDVWDEYAFDIKSIEQLSPEKRTPLIRTVIKRVLKQHPEGLNATTMAELTGLTPLTVRKHLEYLTAVREAYQKIYGKRQIIYYPNGKLVHEFSDTVRSIGASLFSFQRIENTWGKYIYVQERKKDVYSNKTTTVGGILIERDSFEDFIEILRLEAEEWINEDDGHTNKVRIGR